MKLISIRGAAALALSSSLVLGTASCNKDLDREPFFDLNTESVYRDPAGQRAALAKLYSGLITTGQKTTGAQDVQGGDEGATSYSRILWKMQELTTDEAVITWGDGSIQDLNDDTWSSNNDFVQLMYNRIYFQVVLCNDFIREMSDAKLSERGISGNDLTQARRYRAEARFLRALSYYHALDMFGGNVPFVTEADLTGKFFPRQTNAAELFSYLETELKAIDGELVPARQAEYGRADQAAAWTLLSHLYLNAQTYIGAPRNTEVIDYTSRVIGAGFTLTPRYSNLFRADNDRTAASEIIFPIIADGQRTRSYGGTTFLVHASIGGSLGPSSLDTMGVNAGWAGLRAKRNLPLVFGLSTAAQAANPADKRAIFFASRQFLDNNSLTTFRDGWLVTKWRNRTSTNALGSDPTGEFVDTDIPLFRLGDVYLMYAEAHLRGGGGSLQTALQYINALRRRGYGNASGNVSSITLDNILDERMRELYWEGHRRTDLIRFGKFAGASYLWPFKGGAQAGAEIPAYRTIFPIPISDLTANPTLRQNPGY